MMMMSKHTPGQWQTHAIKESVSVFGNDGCLVAVMFETHRLRPRDMAIANANLIAAAPDMLDALKLVVDTFENGGWPSATIVIAKAAIAKAEGNDAATV